MTVLCIESGITYADGVAAVAAEGGANKTFEVSGTNSFATSVSGSTYNLGISIIAALGQETADDGDITIGAKMSGTFTSTATGTDIRNLLTDRLSLNGAGNAVLRRLIVNGQANDGIQFNDTVDAENIIVYNCDDGWLSSVVVSNSLINKCTVVGAARFGYAQGKFSNCVDVNSANQGYFNEAAGSAGTWENDGSGTNSITESPATDVFVDFAGGKYGVLDTSSPGAAGAGAFIFTSGGGGISVTALLNSNYMIEYNMKKNVASQSIGAQMITISDGSNFTGSVAVEVTIDGGTKTTGGGSVTHEGEGYHSYALTQAETNGNHIAVSFAGTGALTQTIQVYTSFPQTVDNDTKISLIPTTAMRGTDSANTVVPPSVAQFNARTIVSADYFLVTDYTAPDNASITSILADTNELQTSQGNWLTATGFSTSAEVAALNDISVADILTTQMTESYAGDGTAPTLAQSLFLTMQNLQDFSYAGTTQTVKKLDGSTAAATYTLNDAVTPTSKTRAS